MVLSQLPSVWWKGGRPRKRRSLEDPTRVLRCLNELSHHLRRGYDERAALQIAETTFTLLQCRVVAVTADAEVIAQFGESIDWQGHVEQHAQHVLDRRRIQKPTLYEFSLLDEQAQVAVAVLSAADVPIGTIHVMSKPGEPLRLKALRELAEMVGSQLELAEVERSRAYIAEAELQALRAQLSPHFLHNSLTAIAGLINADPGRARLVLADFSEFLRATFRTQTDMTTVSEELRLVDIYLELTRVRFGDRFRVLLTIDPEALPVRLPVFSIQALVENAVRHGLETKPGLATLRIVAEEAGSEISITVEDDGVGTDPVLLQQAISGSDSTLHVGIRSIDTRLRSTFGPEYGLVIATAANHGTKVSMRLPKSRLRAALG